MADTSFNQFFFLEMKIGDYPIVPQNVMYMYIREWAIDLAPRLEMTIKDDGYLHEYFNFEDNLPIDIILGKHPDDENPIETRFMLLNHKFNLFGENIMGYVSLVGTIYAPELFAPIKNRSFPNESSLSVISNVVNDCGLTFESGPNFNTDDTMTWLQCNQNNYDFINSVKKRAFKTDDAVFCYGDIYGNIKMTGFVNEAAKSSPKRVRFSMDKYTHFFFDNAEDENTIWYNYYDFVNMNSINNKLNNYGFKCEYYDFEDGFISDNINSSSSNLAQYQYKSKEFGDENINAIHRYFGEQNLDSHTNYSKAVAQNEYFTKNFLSFALVLNVNSISDVKLFDKLEVAIPSLLTNDIGVINDIWSGNYLIVGILHSVGEGGIYKKQVVAVRDGYDKSSYINNLKNT